jgi:hypothetical protein
MIVDLAKPIIKPSTKVVGIFRHWEKVKTQANAWKQVEAAWIGMRGNNKALFPCQIESQH